MYHLRARPNPPFLRDAGLRRQYRGRRVLVLGGDGFMGMHVATALQMLGADVSILSRRSSSLLESEDITIHRGHLMQEEVLRMALRDQDLVFDLAGTSGEVASNRDALRNFTTECEPHLLAFQTAAAMPDPPLIIFCSSRTIYGRPKKLPVSESRSPAPISAHAIHKLMLEQYLQNFHQTCGLNYLIFRLSNAYGPHLWQERKEYGIINQFFVNAFFKQPIRLFGDGSQLRDYVFIDDVVEAFVRAAVQKDCRNQIFNLGGPESVSLKNAVAVLLRQHPGSPIQTVPWPADFRAAETGDYVTDLRKLKRHLPKWKPTNFASGVKITFSAYEKMLGDASASLNTNISLAPVFVERRPTLPKRSRWQGKRVLVTGANGFIGGQLTARLLEMGAFVVAVNRKPLTPALAKHSGIHSVQLDLGGDEAGIRELDSFRPEVVFHFASEPDGPELESHAATCVNVNLQGTIHLLELARRCAVSAFVFADSVKVYGNSPVPHREKSATDPGSSYAASKLAAWQFCRIFSKVHGLKLVALRPTMVYGPGQRGNLLTFLADCLAEGRTDILLQGGFQTRDPLYIDDAVNAYLRVAELANRLSGRAIPIGGGCECTVKDLATLFVRSAGYPTAVHCRQEAIRATEMMRSYCDNTDAWNALRWLPEMPLERGLRRTAEYLLNDSRAQVAPLAEPSENVNGFPDGTLDSPQKMFAGRDHPEG